MNRNALAFFEDMANDRNLGATSVKLVKNNDFSAHDAAFVLRYAGKDSDVLDLGSGTGLLVNKIHARVRSVTAVEPFTNFTRFIIKSDNITVVNENLFSFTPKGKFDVLTLFGVMHYFSEDEARHIYGRYLPFLRDTGTIIIKNQFGVAGDVNVSGFSEELGREYYSQYRSIDKEVTMLRSMGCTAVEVVDIYPAEYSRWENTHFYAIVAGRRSEKGME